MVVQTCSLFLFKKTKIVRHVATICNHNGQKTVCRKLDEAADLPKPQELASPGFMLKEGRTRAT